MEYASVDEAQKMFNNPENVELNGRVLYIDYSTGQEIKNETTGTHLSNKSYNFIFCIFILFWIS